MRNLEEVKRKVESLTTSSLENLLGRIRNLASHLIAEFSRFEAMELLEAIKNAAHDNKNEKANYYRLTCETLRSKLHSCSDAQFHKYLLPLLGDKDQEKILDVMAKVEKSNRNRQGRGFSRHRSEADQPPTDIFAAIIVRGLVIPGRLVIKGREIWVSCPRAGQMVQLVKGENSS